MLTIRHTCWLSPYTVSLRCSHLIHLQNTTLPPFSVWSDVKICSQALPSSQSQGGRKCLQMCANTRDWEPSSLVKVFGERKCSGILALWHWFGAWFGGSTGIEVWVGCHFLGAHHLSLYLLGSAKQISVWSFQTLLWYLTESHTNAEGKLLEDLVFTLEVGCSEGTFHGQLQCARGKQLSGYQWCV